MFNKDHINEYNTLSNYSPYRGREQSREVNFPGFSGCCHNGFLHVLLHWIHVLFNSMFSCHSHKQTEEFMNVKETCLDQAQGLKECLREEQTDYQKELSFSAFHPGWCEHTPPTECHSLSVAENRRQDEVMLEIIQFDLSMIFSIVKDKRVVHNCEK